jgi:hypothetical protein
MKHKEWNGRSDRRADGFGGLFSAALRRTLEGVVYEME